MFSLCDETCENRNFKVMTDDNDKGDDESLNLLKIFSYLATRNKTLSVTLYSTA